NVFAMYITTAFFEVRSPAGPGDPDGDSFSPPLLGREVDARLRHHMFAIIDRTNLSMDLLAQLPNGTPNPAGPRRQGARPIYFPRPPSHRSAPKLAEMNVIPNVPTDPTYWTYVPAYGSQNGQLVLRDTIDHDGREFSTTSPFSGESAAIKGGSLLFL